MRSTHDHPHWLKGVRLYGFEDGDEGTDGDEGDEGADDEEGDEDGSDSEGDDDSGDTAGLKSALRKERRARRQAERETKALKKQSQQKDQQDQEDLAATKASLETEQQKTARLAAKFAETSVNAELRKQARQMRFIDEDVVEALVNRELIEYDQDDDDPASVQIDEDSVKEALEDLKRRKPNLLVAEGSEESSGGKFGGPRKKTGGKKTEQQEIDEAKSLYPAMRNRS